MKNTAEGPDELIGAAVNPMHHSSSSPPLQELHSSIHTVSSTSPAPPPKRRKLTPIRQVSPSIQNTSKSPQHQSTLKQPIPKPKDESLKTSAGHRYLGDFIAEAWSTTSDLKGSTYLSNGDPVLIQRDDAGTRVSAPSASASGTNSLNKAKGGQMKLAFAPKSRAVPNKKSSSSKENNIIRFLNSKGSGGWCIFLFARSPQSNSYLMLLCE